MNTNCLWRSSSGRGVGRPDGIRGWGFGRAMSPGAKSGRRREGLNSRGLASPTDHSRGHAGPTDIRRGFANPTDCSYRLANLANCVS